jgi:hypothetical protein
VSSRAARITDRDLELLSFLAEHRIVTADHVREMLGVSATVAYGRLRALTALGLTTQHKLFYGQRSCYRITRQGLHAVGSVLPAPRIDLRCYAHDIGLAWVWLAARGGRFGPMRAVVSERQMRSRDAGEPDRQDRFGVRLGGYGPGGKPRLHYPDLLLITAEGKRVAVELELTGKGRARRERILGGYGADSRVDAVLYLAENRSIARSVQASAARLGLGSIIHAQPVRWAAGRAPDAAARVAQRARTAGRPGKAAAAR